MVFHVTDFLVAGLQWGFVGLFFIFFLLYWLGVVLYYGIIHLVIRISGHEGRFGDTFLIGQYSALPVLFANLLSLILLFALLPFETITNLSLLILHPVWLIVLGLGSIAYLWGAILLALGIRVRYKLSTGSSLLITLSVTVFFILILFLARLTVIPVT